MDDHSPNPLIQSLFNRPPKIHESMQATLSALTGPTALAEAYAFLAFFKGARYVCKIPSKFAYCCHWLRIRALPDDSETRPVIVNVDRGLMPWGRIIIDLVNEDSTLRLYHEEDRFMAGLRYLRKYVRDYSPKRPWPQWSLAEVTNFVMQGLIEAKLIDDQIISVHYFSKLKECLSKLNAHQLPNIERVTYQPIDEKHYRDYLRIQQSIEACLKRSLFEK